MTITLPGIRIQALFAMLLSLGLSGCGGSSAPLGVPDIAPVIDYIKASNTGAGDAFGIHTALSADGNTLAVGAYRGEASSANTINDHAGGLNNDLPAAGAVYVFKFSGGIWQQQSYVKASNPGLGDSFGSAMALSSDGSTMMVGALGEGSMATGINGEQGNNASPYAGAAYVFTRSTDTWSQRAYVKASNTNAQDRFGESVALSANGRTFVVGASGEASKATGVDGDQLDNAMSDAGAVYVLNTLN